MNAPAATRLLLVAHAPLAEAMRQVALHAFPDCAADLGALDVQPQASQNTVAAQLTSLLDERPTLILVDVAGATPANGVQHLLSRHAHLRAVAGLNVAMLWRVLCYRLEDPDCLAERAIAGAQRGISKLNPTP